MNKLEAKIALAIPAKYRHLFHQLECKLGRHITIKSAVDDRLFCLLCDKDLVHSTES